MKKLLRQALTSVPLQFPQAGCTTIPFGLLTTTKSSSSYTMLISIFSGYMVSETTGKLAETHFEVIERFKDYCLVKFELKTGLQHTLRCLQNFSN